MGRLIIRLGDTSTHGGQVSSAASKSYAEGKPIARKGDSFTCPLHGEVVIAEGSDNTLCEGPQVARHGDALSCGGTLISGASKTFVN